MSYTLALNMLREIIERKQKEPTPVRCSSLFYLIGAIHQAFSLEATFKEYLKSKEELLYVDLYYGSCAIGYGIADSLDNGDLNNKVKFIIEELLIINKPQTIKMLHAQENCPTLEEIKTSNDFIIKNLEEICLELDALNYPITHNNDERCLKIISWWDDYKTSKI